MSNGTKLNLFIFDLAQHVELTKQVRCQVAKMSKTRCDICGASYLCCSLLKEEKFIPLFLCNSYDGIRAHGFNVPREFVFEVGLNPNPDYIDNPDKLKNERETFNGGSEEVDSKIKDINELGKLYIDNINNYGDSQWYHWCNKNWGTKWNVSEDVDVDYDDSTEEYNICFNTAWCPPYGIIDKYSEMCNDGEFDWEYENEDYDGHHYITKENGELIERVVDEPDYDTDDEMEI